MMAPKPKFQEGEKVLCYHGPLLYEAKCIRSEVKDGKFHYQIHYNGWNKNWDESVQESRVVKFNEAGIQKQQELLKNHGAMTKKKKAAKKLEKEALKLQKGKKEKEKEKLGTKEKESLLTKDKDKSLVKEKLTAREEKKKEKEKETKEKDTSSSSQPTPGDKRKEREKEKEKDKKEKEKDKDKEKEKEKEPEKEKTGTATPQPPAVVVATDAANGTKIADNGEPKRKRVRLDNTVESDDAYLCKLEVKVKIPDDLKPVLVDDWDLITRQKMLVAVPCKQTVDDLIADYIKSKSAKSTNVNKDAILETMLGCKDYFNVMLGSQLLYKFERPQYGEVVAENPDKPMSSIYGAVHFLRLFVRLGAMLTYTTIDERTVHILLNHIHDFLKYLSKNGASLFKTSMYEIATPDYHRKAI